jgi:hypothetical protein
MKIFLVSLAALSILFNSCKKECTGTYTISGVLRNGTTLQPMKKVQFQFAVFNEVRTQTRDYKVLGTAMTDDSGRFYFEYPCLNDDYKHGYIYIYSLAPNGGIRKVEDFSKDLKTELFYSTVGKAQVVLKPKKPLGSDTLFLCLQDYTGEYKDFDSFVNSAPYNWRKYNGKIGGYGVVIYGKGRKNFNEALNDINLGQWEKIIITGDPIVDSIYLYY